MTDRHDDEPEARIHVIPCFPGERKHEESIDCWCRPRRDIEEPIVVIHERRAEA